MKRGRDAQRPERGTSDAIAAAIDQVLTNWRADGRFSEELAGDIIFKAREQIMAEPMLVQVDAPINICGDIHGQIHDLAVILNTGQHPPNARYLFLGDYVDRGKHGIECMCVLLGFKILYPSNIVLLRGNHESSTLTKQYGFFDECKRRYSPKLWKKFVDVFNCLPVAALVEGSALCMHGGLSPELQTLEQIEMLSRPCEVPDSGLLCDLLWSDPEPGRKGWGQNDRGVSYTFGEQILREKLQSLDVDVIIRAHQVQDNGYSFFGGRGLVTVFSASNYCGEFTNCGAMLMMDAELTCSFQVFKPRF